MPLQNRVTPFGTIVTIGQRGIFTGNRGIIHNPVTRTLLGRRWSSKSWIVCVCDFRGRRRDVMGGRSWTELFFLDEAIALAAGHRPCFQCRHAAAEAFREAWARAAGGPAPRAAAMDDVLHRERLDGRGKRVHPVTTPVADLADGTVVVAGGMAYTLVAGQGFRWAEGGYRAPVAMTAADGVLTPPSTVAALRAGYRPVLHPDIVRQVQGFALALP